MELTDAARLVQGHQTEKFAVEPYEKGKPLSKDSSESLEELQGEVDFVRGDFQSFEIRRLPKKTVHVSNRDATEIEPLEMPVHDVE